jgi:uncharacterized alkaline shock family protein YloU
MSETQTLNQSPTSASSTAPPMSTTSPTGSSTSPTGSSAGKAPSRSMERSPASGGASLKTEHGTTSISSSVVAKIAALATQEIPGVQALGKSLSRTFGSIRSKVPGASAATAQGVSVEVGERQAAVDIDIVCYYGQSIVETADAIRQNVIERIEGMTGLEVVEVNINIDDLHIDDDGTDGDSRVE